MNIPFVDISSATIDPEAIQLVNEKLAKKYLLIPLYFEGKMLIVAMADPLNLNAIDDVRFSAGLQVRPCVATSSDIAEAIEELSRVVYLTKEDKGLTGVCPSCLQPIMVDSEVCPHCERFITGTCPSCGKARQADWIICPFCATMFEPPKKPLLKDQAVS